MWIPFIKQINLIWKKNIEAHWDWINFKPKLKWFNAGFTSSVTRLGELLDFGQLFEAFGNN